MRTKQSTIGRTVSVLFFLALFAASFAITMIVTYPGTKASAHNFSPDFTWHYPDVTPNLEGRQTFPYTSVLCNNAKPDLSTNTNLNFPTCSYSNTDASDKQVGDILHFYGDYGHSRWIGFSHAWWWGSGSLECTSPATGAVTGNCNTSNRQSTFAFVYWNTNGGEDFSAPFLADHLTRHETIHAFGITDSCEVSLVSIMKLGSCGLGYYVLQDHDRQDLRTKYPLP